MISLPVTIRTYQSSDAEAIAKILLALWGDDSTWLAAYSVHKNWSVTTHNDLVRRTVVAEVNETVVGAGTIFESTIHPLMFFITINVVPEWSRRGIGTMLLKTLTQLGDGRPMLVKLTRRDPAGVAFFTRYGFKPLVQSMIGLLDPVDSAVRDWLEQLPSSVESFAIVSFSPDTSSMSLADIALIHSEIYRQQHEWNPPAEVSAEQAVSRFCNENVIAGSQLCAYNNSKLVGASHLMSLASHPGEAYLVNVGVDRHLVDEPQASRLSEALIRASIERAAQLNLPVRFEADDDFVPDWALYLEAPASELDTDSILFQSGSMEELQRLLGESQ